MEIDQRPGFADAGAALALVDERPLTPLHPDHVKVLRLGALLIAVPLALVALVLESSGLPVPGMALVPAVLAIGWIVLLAPMRRYHARGYDMAEDRLQVVKGLLFRADTVVPFGRVQHLDVEQNPLERWYGLATLTLHTAGTHNSSVSLPGLTHENALAMREVIRAHVRRETM